MKLIIINFLENNEKLLDYYFNPNNKKNIVYYQYQLCICGLLGNLSFSSSIIIFYLYKIRKNKRIIIQTENNESNY